MTTSANNATGSGGKKGKKDKGQKMSLGQFMADANTGSWADEVMDLPTTTVATYEAADQQPSRPQQYGQQQQYGRQRDASAAMPERAWRDDKPQRGGSSRPERDQFVAKPMPDSPPYTAYIGNLPYSVTESALADLFAPNATNSIRIPHDRENADRIKGFAYVEFAQRDGLQYAVDTGASGGLMLDNRRLRVDVADAPKNREGGRPDDDRNFSGAWRRDAPVVSRPSSTFSRSAGDAQGPRQPRSDFQPRDDEKFASNWRNAGPPPVVQQQSQRSSEARSFSGDRPAREQHPSEGQSWRRGDGQAPPTPSNRQFGGSGQHQQSRPGSRAPSGPTIKRDEGSDSRNYNAWRKKQIDTVC